MIGSPLALSCCPPPRSAGTFSSMNRAKLVIIVVLVVIAGFVVGWWLSGRVHPPHVSPVKEEQASTPAAVVSTGYCCLTVGQACVLVQTPSACFTQNGKGFNTRQATCDRFCIGIGSFKR